MLANWYWERFRAAVRHAHGLDVGEFQHRYRYWRRFTTGSPLFPPFTLCCTSEGVKLVVRGGSRGFEVWKPSLFGGPARHWQSLEPLLRMAMSHWEAEQETYRQERAEEDRLSAEAQAAMDTYPRAEGPFELDLDYEAETGVRVTLTIKGHFSDDQVREIMARCQEIIAAPPPPPAEAVSAYERLLDDE